MAGQLTIDLDAVAANFHLLRSLAHPADVAPVLKANAYGLGIGPISRRLWKEGARTFFVARAEEGVELLELLGFSREATVYVLDGYTPEEAETFKTHPTLSPVLNSQYQVKHWLSTETAGLGLAALQIDTGLNRLGISSDETSAVVESMIPHPPKLLLSHLARASEDVLFNERQRQCFVEACSHFLRAKKSLANSAGICLGEAYSFDVVRPGIGLFGAGMLQTTIGFRQAATLRSPILQVRPVRRGETVGYGAYFQAEVDTNIAIIAAGYADGILRNGSDARSVCIDGRRCPIVGKVTMDYAMVELGANYPLPNDNHAEIFGESMPIDEFAAQSGTIANEILVRLGARFARTYIGAKET